MIDLVAAVREQLAAGNRDFASKLVEMYVEVDQAPALGEQLSWPIVICDNIHDELHAHHPRPGPDARLELITELNEEALQDPDMAERRKSLVAAAKLVEHAVAEDHQAWAMEIAPWLVDRYRLAECLLSLFEIWEQVLGGRGISIFDLGEMGDGA